MSALLQYLVGRRIACSGACGKSWRVRDRRGTATESIICADCHSRRRIAPKLPSRWGEEESMPRMLALTKEQAHG